MQHPRHLFVLLFPWLAVAALGAEPLTTRTDPVGTSLNQWFAEGKAAGFAALQYENHDGAHSLLPSAVYPSLRHYQATPAEIQAGRDKGPVAQIREIATIGNCSMAAPPTQGGSLPRLYLMDAGASEFIAKQYLTNQLFVYPEHLDYDLGANGVSGYGDLFPANSPCILISQGSSHSDMPFVKALLATAAAFRPEIQRQLIQQRILAPTLQAILRQHTTLVVEPDDYYSGKAHPPVFDASTLDELKMVTAAQIMTRLSIPPLAFLQVVSEQPKPDSGDWFELPEIKTNALSTTPAFISRLYRSTSPVHEIRLSGSKSVDTEKRPLIYEWRLLQGDPKRVEIIPSDSGEEATVRVRWHPPMHAPSGIRSHRVEIALFVRSPLAISAPAILSFYMLPNEMRFFDAQGRLSEVFYQAGNPEIGLPVDLSDERWLAFVEAAISDTPSVPSKIFNSGLTDKDKTALATLWKSLQKPKLTLDQLTADPSRQGELDTARKNLSQAIREHSPAIQSIAQRLIAGLTEESDLFLTHQTSILAHAQGSPALTDLRAELKRLTLLNVLVEQADGTFTLARRSPTLTDADRYYLRQLHLTIVSQVLLPGLLRRSPAPLYVDPRLSSIKPWRDVYRYTSKGEPDGWLRHVQGRVHRFDNQGRLIDDNDLPQSVRYFLKEGHLTFETAIQAGK